MVQVDVNDSDNISERWGGRLIATVVPYCARGGVEESGMMLYLRSDAPVSG